ncbi:uncharacterized protein PITG_11518 [Phytophthora infestans T30-4]|uniref:Uncharacterized protein n=1 Tax=Phytophthora infestans (strain T30-4) TaxID=403677 RepID=D0NIY5_PHYIT|nr:uncharacterized protein PITG_11518 [Phytophthora infestans T30-4]EEY59469.1 conserved hypothetical protein [Phytophthora infestans T30-4]|eukprot:XP_002901079.1 conserved hypothetical protein [Phytophthora infestans T30-4]
MTLSRSEKSKRTGKSLMVLHGAIDGNLDDCMFGSFATTEETWRWRSSYVYEGLDEARLLATIRGPTPEDPFRFLGLKWFTKELPSVLSGIMQQRDFLIIEATGLTRDSNGERVGYFLMHSKAHMARQEQAGANVSETLSNASTEWRFPSFHALSGMR